MASFKWPIVTQRVLMKSNRIIRLRWMDGYSLKHQKRKNSVIPPLISCAKASTVCIVLCAILLWTKVWIILVELPFLRCLIPFLYESFIFIDRKFKDWPKMGSGHAAVTYKKFSNWSEIIVQLGRKIKATMYLCIWSCEGRLRLVKTLSKLDDFVFG